jgi:hypothetical protein
LTIYKPDITQEILRRLTNRGPNSYLKLYECVKIHIERSISFRDYSNHLDKMYEKKWLVKTDEFEGKRGKRISIRITSEGKLAFRHNVLIEDWDRLTQGIMLLLMLGKIGMYTEEKITSGIIPPGSRVEVDPLTGDSTYYTGIVTKGIRMEDLVTKFRHNRNNTIFKIDFHEELSDILLLLKEKNPVKSKFIYENGVDIDEYYISKDLSPFVSGCVDLLEYNKMRFCMFLSFVDKALYDYKSDQVAFVDEKEWALRIYGEQDLKMLKISCNSIRKGHVKMFKEMIKEMRKGKNLDKLILDRFNSKTLNQYEKPLNVVGEEMRRLDLLVKSKYEEVDPYYNKVMETDDFALYADLMLNLSHPKFLRFNFFDRFLKFYNIEKKDIEPN